MSFAWSQAGQNDLEKMTTGFLVIHCSTRASARSTAAGELGRIDWHMIFARSMVGRDGERLAGVWVELGVSMSAVN